MERVFGVYGLMGGRGKAGAGLWVAVWEPERRATQRTPCPEPRSQLQAHTHHITIESNWPAASHRTAQAIALLAAPLVRCPAWAAHAMDRRQSGGYEQRGHKRRRDEVELDPAKQLLAALIAVGDPQVRA